MRAPAQFAQVAQMEWADEYRVIAVYLGFDFDRRGPSLPRFKRRPTE
jgi:hypothetical protein